MRHPGARGPPLSGSGTRRKAWSRSPWKRSPNLLCRTWEGWSRRPGIMLAGKKMNTVNIFFLGDFKVDGYYILNAIDYIFIRYFKKFLFRPPMITPNSSNPRRISARMGVATSVRGQIPPPPTFVAPTSTSASVSTNSAVVTRRQTLTGIRTTPQHSNRRPPMAVKQTSHRDPSPKIIVHEDKNVEPIYANVGSAKRSASKDRVASSAAQIKNGAIPKSSRLLSDKRHDRPVVTKRQESDEEKGQRKSKRLEGRRFLTIGYEGEVRSPFRERQNVLPTVQRSKSAQTPKPKTTTSGPKRENSDDEIFAFSEAAAASVLRSKSLRTPNSGIKVPASLRETIYDVTTPKSEKVRRNLSDRVVTPRAGRGNEAGPFIKTALTNSRAKGATPMRTPSRGLVPGASPRVVLNRY